jgi:hypothetical protein
MAMPPASLPVPPLHISLTRVAKALHAACDPWWVIGSAAVWLHGGATEVADIDVLSSARDARAMLAAWRGPVTIGAASERFRSQPFARLQGDGLPIEVMAELEVRIGGAWQIVRPRTRVAMGGVFVPERAELVAILRSFGREKDLRRATLLESGVA